MDKWEKIFKEKLVNIKKWHKGEVEISRTFSGSLVGPFFSFENQQVFKTQAINISIPPEVSDNTPVHSIIFASDDFQQSSQESEELLSKMILAMKLDEDEFICFRGSFLNEQIVDYSKNFESPSEASASLFKKIIETKPRVVASLGATVTHILLGKKEKLSAIHGDFIERTVTYNGKKHSFLLVPIFHPDLLLINPNMKRTAWIDLQKIISFIRTSSS